MKKISIAIILIIAVKQQAAAQGCVAVRQMGGVHTACSAQGASYNLGKGDIQAGVNYRNFHSWRHFVGTEEQKHRQNTNGGIGADGKDRGNAVNIFSHAIDLNFSYGLTNRLQVNATLPWVSNERSQVLRQTAPVKDTFRYSVFARGFGDIRLSVSYWLFNPLKKQNGNVLLGLGVKLNNGKYNAVDVAPMANGTQRYAVMDQAIQPGDGGIGFTAEVQAFQKIARNLYGFASAYYLFNPKESNGVFKSKADSGLAGYNIYACPDQYLLRGGLAASVGKKKNVDISLAYRWEGIPAYDAFGGQVAYRRPGYVMAIEPGIVYRAGKHVLSLYVPYNFKKNRIQSAADIAKQNMQNDKITDPSQKVHIQGDAAFADYSINLGYAFRITKKK
ncbi:MAG: hypothetical protein RL172_2800 [Bacteroidota bacterium]|jgi:hypothetical protein